MTRNVTERDAYEIGMEAYQYLYPLITMEVTRRVMTNVPGGVKPGLGPVGTWQHMRAYPDANFREVVRPNFDTLYSICWLDLTTEPMVVSIPDSQDRYYLLPMLDMWTDVFAVPGKRTSGTGAQTYAVVPPGWSGELPAGVDRIDAPTRYVWIVVRTQTNGPKDYEAVHVFQNGLSVAPLSQFGKTFVPPPFTPDPTVDMKTPPLNQVNDMPVGKYFAYGAQLMKLHPPHLTDWSTIARLKRIGIVAGENFDFNSFSPAVQAAFKRAAADALKLMTDTVPTLARVVNGWQMLTDTMGVYGNNYLNRAIIAMIGLGANQCEDAIYPLNVADADGRPVDAADNYIMHFNKDEIPPAEAFWSLTMYDAEGFQVANELDRFAIGDRSNLQYNPDGSLDLYLQHVNPGKALESNWLPTPAKGVLGLTMRLYAPRAVVRNGQWAPPAIKKVVAQRAAA